MSLLKIFDPILGVDLHPEWSPVGVPLPMPNPFIGTVFDSALLSSEVLSSCPPLAAVLMAMDPLGAAVNIAFDSAEGIGGAVNIGSIPSANTQMTGDTTVGVSHKRIPPGVAFVVSPSNDATFPMGSQTVTARHWSAVRDSDMTLTCSFPVRLPTAIAMSLPTGAPVLAGGPPAVDTNALIDRAARAIAVHAVRGAAGALARMVSRRIRNAQSTAHATCVNDPVDVATGRQIGTYGDWELPGPIPLAFERTYSSAVADRDSSLGHGWSHTLGESVWAERGRVVYLGGDGREIEFDAFALPGHAMSTGDVVYEPMNRLTLRALGEGRWEIESADGVVHEFAPIVGDRRTGVSRLSRIRNRSGHAITLTYDARANLEWVNDSAGRWVRFEHDDHGRLVRAALPHPSERGWLTHTRYEYSREGDLVAVIDPLGNATRHEYSGHLMVRKTDRTGLSFYYGYDGVGASAWCVRVWGDGGIYDMVLDYDKLGRVTITRNSLGEQTVYRMDDGLNVVKVIDAVGGVTERAYDDARRKVSEKDALGNETRWEWDARGNCVRVVGADGNEVIATYDGRNLRTRYVNEIGAEWRWDYDVTGMLAQSVDPMGHTTRAGHGLGLLAWVELPGGATTRFEYDQQGNVVRVIAANGGVTSQRYDALGRAVETTNALGGTTRIRHDAIGNMIAVQSPTGTVAEYAYDAVRKIVEARDATRHVKLAYNGSHKVVAREEGGTRVTLEYDTEDRLTAVVNEAGERHGFALDALGRVKREESFDGVVKRYDRDKLGRVAVEHLSRGRANRMSYDAMGRVTEIAWWDGTTTAFAWRADGALMCATNGTATIEYDRDALGRVVRECVDGNWVTSAYGAEGARALMESSMGARQVAVRDVMGDVAELHHGDGAGGQDFVVRIGRNAAGLETARRMPGGVIQTWERDLAGRPVARRTREGAAEVDARSYRWNGDDQISAIVDAVRGPTSYQHDARGRLTEQHSPDGSVLHRAMDAVGNVYRRADGSDRVYGRGGRIVSDADGTSYTHDEDGNLVEKRLADGTAWKYAWDATGMLRRVERPDGKRVEMEYDALARRVRKVVHSARGESVESRASCAWDGDFVVHETVGQGETTTWYWQPGTWAPVVKEVRGKRWSVASDHLGTPTEMRDEAGRVAWRMQMDVFGVATEIGEAGACPWRWAGQCDDRDVGWVYNRYRYYDKTCGAYTRKDPIGLLGGSAAYAYVDAPTLAIDPHGLFNAYDIAALRDFNRSPNVRDGMDGHELLQSAWLRTNRNAGRRSALGGGNPAMALPPGIHDAASALQASFGLHDPARLSRQSAANNIRANAAVLRLALVKSGAMNHAEAQATVSQLEGEAMRFVAENSLGCS